MDRGNRPAIKDYDPYTQRIITAEVPTATAEDVDRDKRVFSTQLKARSVL